MARGAGRLLCGAILVVSLTSACARRAASDGSASAARQVLAPFLKPGADYVALTLRLKPTRADYRALFVTQGLAARAERQYGKLWAEAAFLPVRPAPGQTELHLWRATTEELSRGSGDAASFPAPYKQASAHLKPGLTLYAWGFSKKGEKPDPVFDGLCQVNGRWVTIPRPWRITGTAAPSEAAPPGETAPLLRRQAPRRQAASPRAARGVR
jgi:hypothetical protein